MNHRIIQVFLSLFAAAIIPASPAMAQSDDSAAAIDDLQPVASPDRGDDANEVSGDNSENETIAETDDVANEISGDNSDSETIGETDDVANEVSGGNSDNESVGGTDDGAVGDPDDEFVAEEPDEYEDAVVPRPTERQSELDELRSSFELYKAALANGSFDEADTLAKRLVELAIKIYGINSLDASLALTNLAIVQTKNEDYEAAQLNFNSAVEIIERIEDRLHVALVNPLKGLATAQLASGRPDMAMKTFTRAVHVTHVNEGPHNLMQVDLLEMKAETLISMGEVDDALDIQQSIYTLQSRNVDLGSEEIIPALERQADWLHRLNMYHRERATWRKIIKILESTRGKNDISLIPPLTGLGQSYLFFNEYDLDSAHESPISSGEIYLKRAVRIATENPEATWKTTEDTLLALGDYYTMSSRPNPAKRVYMATWDLLSVDEERLSNRRTQLEKPVVLQNIRPPKYYNSERSDDDAIPENFERGTVVAGYTITARGETASRMIVESDPPGFTEMEQAMLRELKYLMYRPRFEDGEPAVTPNFTYTHEFFYRPSDMPVFDKPSEDPEVAAKSSEE